MAISHTSAESHDSLPMLKKDSESGEPLMAAANTYPSSVRLAQTPKVGLVASLAKPRRPHMKRNVSLKLVFSVDDGEDEVVHEMEREYLEGYSDALKFRLKLRVTTPSKTSLEVPGSPNVRQRITSSPLLRKTDESAPNTLRKRPAELESSIIENLRTAELNLRLLEFIEDSSATHSPRESPGHGSPPRRDSVDNFEELILEHEISRETKTPSDSSSTNSMESMTLRERQNAINKTHPFGIKIWKPSLYKKKRSVEQAAEDDIHEQNQLNITWGVYLTNLIWSLSFGVLLFLACCLGALFNLGLSLAGTVSNLDYCRLWFDLGLFLWFPFGKYVLLTKDENYIHEDVYDGRSVSEFRKWRSEEEGRLFFIPLRRSEVQPLLGDIAEGSSNRRESISHDEDAVKKRFFGRGDWNLSRIVFYAYFYLLFQPLMYFVSIVCWMFVFTIPMGKILNLLTGHLRRHPLALSFPKERNMNDEQIQQKKAILVCTYRVAGLRYYKYTVDGTNIFFINLMSSVLFVIFDYYVLREAFGWRTWYTDDFFIFGLCLFSIIPLAYFIGQAVASISAQSSMGLGAVINAFFSTVVEIFLYCVSLDQNKAKLVEGSMIGSILAAVLLLPGLSMCGGAIKRKTQRYNPKSAGVSSTMLLFAIIVMFVPSMFHQMYGSYEIQCIDCETTSLLSQLSAMGEKAIRDCKKCHFLQPPLVLDLLYTDFLRPFSVFCAVTLFIVYGIGLWFTLRTHAAMIWASQIQAPAPIHHHTTPSVLSLDHPTPVAASTGVNPSSVATGTNQVPSANPVTRVRAPQKPSPAHTPVLAPVTTEEAGGHEGPNWSKQKSTIILLGATILYAVIAEILVDTVDVVLHRFPINPKFLGLTVFALVPNTTEFLNAISFAINGNVALSMEIGSAYALQVVLIQIPVLIIYTVVRDFKNVSSMFTLVFPKWDLIATIMSVYLFTYVYAEGKSNYFKGCILILTYFIIMLGFWYNDKIEESGIFHRLFMLM
ncbi:hypothetical protein BABINDRAFT_160601 [Babjeviella inositovora NRRL Y-12698]|uniref:Sodium/calcium exchanger membrane region domain-containing protein n=1 Tax=Babjeviella inositovora NRRL Y-12698 TaxID=984486 RepID=A0A1E3QU52_9ASCO|nr:uncharacterized protein BABINDRAFT_160601 [Babjeviella inositovora NRRL Y-12698]ODQ81213.1 hypothetical protein BABINDRAFT_160601 [Babjeviella inositovora NRRL Y-12698]